MAVPLVASVVFLKIQDFARRPASEQTRLRAQLQAVVAVTAAEIPVPGRIVLDASDGAAVVVLDDPQAALRLAQRALTAVAAGLPLSAGLNHGTLQLAGRKGGEGMTGDGLAVAASVAEFAAPPQLYASDTFRAALADAAPGAEAALVPSGTFTDPGLRTHELYAPDEGAPARRRRHHVIAGLALAAALIGAGAFARAFVPGQRPQPEVLAERVQPHWHALQHRLGMHRED